MPREEKDSRTQGVSVSFLDVIACAFGAIVLLVLILPIGRTSSTQPDATESISLGRLLMLSEVIDKELASLSSEIKENKTLVQQISRESESTAEANETLATTIALTRSKLERTKAETDLIEKSKILMSQPIPSGNEQNEVPTELSGIPVDAEYLAFVIDTSGSMQMIWESVMKEVERFWMLYPKLKGFQILSDNGRYMQRFSKGRWINDSQATRTIALRQMRTWSAFSNSSPAEGITAAINDLYEGGKKMAIVVIGDDYNGSSFEEFFDEIETQVTKKSIGEDTLRIHALGFWNPDGSMSPRNFTILMRELTRRYDGAFVGVEPSGYDTTNVSAGMILRQILSR